MKKEIYVKKYKPINTEILQKVLGTTFPKMSGKISFLTSNNYNISNIHGNITKSTRNNCSQKCQKDSVKITWIIYNS